MQPAPNSVGMGCSLERSMVGRPARPLPPGRAENLHIPVKQAGQHPVGIFLADVFWD